jgi:hypothetical protein
VAVGDGVAVGNGGVVGSSVGLGSGVAVENTSVGNNVGTWYGVAKSGNVGT